MFIEVMVVNRSALDLIANRIRNSRQRRIGASKKSLGRDGFSVAPQKLRLICRPEFLGFGKGGPQPVGPLRQLIPLSNGLFQLFAQFGDLLMKRLQTGL